jgi:hypothetical protein
MCTVVAIRWRRQPNAEHVEFAGWPGKRAAAAAAPL